MKLPLCCLALFVAVCGAAAALPSAVTLTTADGSRLRIEALDEHILHFWLKPAGADFTREPSLATSEAPVTRVPLTTGMSGGLAVVESTALSARVDLRTLTLDVLDRQTGTPLLAHAHLERAAAPATADAPWTLTQALDADEHLLGLGQDNHNNGRLDRRGVIRELWAGQQINSGNVTAEYPVPFLLSTGRNGQAYGLFFDNVHRLRFDLGSSMPDQVKLDAAGGEIDFYVIGGPRLADIIERYTRLTGRPSLPPLWALGYWQSKCTYYDWTSLDEAYAQLTARGFPVDVMVIDADWPEVVTDYVWAKRWTDTAGGLTPGEKVAAYAKKGVKIVMSQSGPMVRKDSPTFPSGWAAGVFATDGKGNPVEAGYYGGMLMDFTHPKMNDWLWPQTRKLNEAGVAGWWLDLTEPEGEPPQVKYFGGGAANIHNQYSQLCTLSFEGVQLAVHPEQRPFILTRSGSAGLQRHHAAVWTGDIYSDYATYRAHPPEMLNAGLSGFTWWTCDTGGFLTGYYKDDQLGAHARLYERWMQFSAFSPITRAHKAGGSPEPYQFGPATEQSTKHYLQQRYRLLPYIYSYAWEASQTGLPLVRPLALEYQDDPRALATPGDEYLFGRELLVAPVLYEGLTNRKVYFPAGRWIDWDTGVEYAGGREWVVAAPQNRIPVAVRAGAIIPLAPDMRHTGEKSWDPVTLEIFPAGKSGFTLYSDDGASFAYRQGGQTITRITSDATDETVRLAITESNQRFAPAVYQARFHLNKVPAAVTNADGLALPFAWDVAARVLSVAIDARGALAHGLIVTLGGASLPARPAPELIADVINPKAESDSSVGKPVPHFFPAPALPARVKAIDYDQGGEGIAFHRARPAGEKSSYRPDSFSLSEGTDVGGGYVLGGLQAGEWARYTVDCGNGGWFDLTARVASAQGGGQLRVMALDQVLAVVEVPATGGNTVWRDVTIPGVYLNPGEISLMVYIDRPGFALNTFDFARAAQPPSLYPATRATRRGVVEIVRAGGPAGQDIVHNLGRIGSSLTWGVVAPRAVEATLRLRYQNDKGKDLPYELKIGPAAARPLALPATGTEWKTFEIKVPLAAGANAVQISGLVDGWDSVAVESLQLVLPDELR